MTASFSLFREIPVAEELPISNRCREMIGASLQTGADVPNMATLTLALFTAIVELETAVRVTAQGQ